MSAESGGAKTVTAEQIRQSLGDMGVDKVAAIIATGATPEEFEEALAWAAGESDVMGEMEKPLTGAAAAVYDILVSTLRYPDEEEAGPSGSE